MTVFDGFKSKNIDELAEWLDKYGVQDFSPWNRWFDKKYCNNCEPETVCLPEFTDRELECAWCELNNGKCKFFPDMDKAPWGKQLVKLWLESEDNNGV